MSEIRAKKGVIMIEKLLAYQETDKKLKELETKLNGSEEKKQTFVAYKYITTVGELVAKLDAKADDLYNKLAMISDKEKELSKQLEDISSELNNAENTEELSYMLKKADEVLNALKALETTADKITSSSSAVKEEYDSIKVKTKRAQEQYNVYSKKFAELKKSLDPEIASVNAELDKLKKDISPELMQKYEAKRKDKVFPILKELNGNKCSSCGMELSMKDISDLENGKIIECDNCRSLVYKQK